jgi:hypothetical protein
VINGDKSESKRPFGIRRIILKYGFKKGCCELVDWIHLPQDVDQNQILINTIINLEVK